MWLWFIFKFIHFVNYTHNKVFIIHIEKSLEKSILADVHKN